MPGSFVNFDSAVAYLVRHLAPRSFLDIGCGAGKYGKMVQREAPDCHRIGMEIEPRYVTDFQLGNIYQDLRIGDASKLLTPASSEFFDLCIIGDCIEHMPKSVGLDLLNLLTYRTQYTIVLAPEFSVQGSVNGVDSESHISVWSEHDFMWHDRWAWDNCLTITAFVLRGYQPCKTSLDTLIEGLNMSMVPLTDFYGERMVRTADFKLQIRLREDHLDGVAVNYRPK